MAVSSATTRSSPSRATAASAKSGGPRSLSTSPRQRARASSSSAAAWAGSPIPSASCPRSTRPAKTSASRSAGRAPAGSPPARVPSASPAPAEASTRRTARDVGPQRGRGAVGGGLAPHRGHQVLAAERPVGVEQQQRQQLPGPRAAQRHGTMAGVGHLEWPQDAEAGRRRALLGGRFARPCRSA